jgi:selenide,water dikinase
VHPNRVWTKAAARPNDVLVLTKPLGVGLITTVLKAGQAAPAHIAAAVETMKKLNRQAAQLIQQVGVHAATDVTGFALLGHGVEMAEKSSVGLRFHLSQIPFLDGAEEYADMWLFPGGTCDNERAYEHAVTFAPGIEEEMQQLLYTPETSGGLLAAIPAAKAERLMSLFAEAGHPCWVIGEVVEGAGVEVLA